MTTAKSNITKLTNRLKKIGFEIERSHGHNHSTAFINKNGFYIYISSNDGQNDFLIRTASDNKDFSGGSNSFVKITSDFEEAIDQVNVKLKESINTQLDSNSVAVVDYPMISLTYDLGDSTDADRFKSKFDTATEISRFIELNIPSLEILPDPEADEDTWNIGNVDIDLTLINNNATLLKQFIDFTDSI